MPSALFRKLKTPKGQLIYFAFDASVLDDILQCDAHVLNWSQSQERKCFYASGSQSQHVITI